MQIVKVAVEKAAYHFDRLYDYMLPPDLNGSVQTGCRVLVPFGTANSHRQAVVFSVENVYEIPKGVKPVLRLLDERPVLTAELLKLAEWISEQCFCTFFEAARVMLRDEKRSIAQTLALAEVCLGLTSTNDVV